jgi:hypothetical protein
MSIYEIRVRGRLDAHWATWLAGLTLAYEGDNTVLRGPLADEAALHGVLNKIAGLNLHLLSVIAVETGDEALDTPAGIGHEPDTLEAPSSEPMLNELAPKTRTKAGTRRKRRRK